MIFKLERGYAELTETTHWIRKASPTIAYRTLSQRVRWRTGTSNSSAHIPPDTTKSLLIAFNNVAASVTSVQLKQPHVNA